MGNKIYLGLREWAGNKVWQEDWRSVVQDHKLYHHPARNYNGLEFISIFLSVIGFFSA